MKKIASFIICIFSVICLNAQNPLNNNADNIIGTYLCKQKDNSFKVKIEKLSDGTYKGQLCWIEKDKDKDGNKLLDKKNSNKKLRNTPLDRVVIFSGLKYNAKEKIWDDCKIYDPQRGVEAKLEIWFEKDGTLRVKGSKWGFSESVYWQKL